MMHLWRVEGGFGVRLRVTRSAWVVRLGLSVGCIAVCLASLSLSDLQCILSHSMAISAPMYLRNNPIVTHTIDVQPAHH